MTDISSFDLFAFGASTTGDYYSAASSVITRKSDYHTALSTSANTYPPLLSFRKNPPRPVASSIKRKVNAKRNLAVSQDDSDAMVEGNNDVPGTPRTVQQQTLADANSTAMSKCLEPLLAAKETTNKPTKYEGTRDGNADGWMMLMKRHSEQAHAKATPLDRAWTMIEFLENEARDYIINK